MAGDVLALILRLSLCLSLALLAVMALRLPVRRLAGARLAYGLWLLIPLVGLSALVPAKRAGWIDPLLVIRVLAAPVAAPSHSPPLASPAPAPSEEAAVPLTAAAAPPLATGPAPMVAPAATGLDTGLVWLAIWVTGALASSAWIVGLQARFVASLGRLRADPSRPGVYHADGGEGPAVVGLWRARIVLPPGFERQYGAGEQALILAHEGVHLRAFHPLINALSAGLICLQWFNPLAHLALRMMRLDQELACDATVIAEHPELRADYARAMLKTGGVHPALPLACAWPAVGRGALKRRIALLRVRAPGPWRRAVMGLGLAIVVGMGGIAAHGAGLNASRAEMAVNESSIDLSAVDAQVKSLTIPPRPPEPLMTDAKVWADRAVLASDMAISQHQQATRAYSGLNVAIWEPRRPYSARGAQHSEAQAAAARQAVAAATRLGLATAEPDKAAARKALQAAQDNYRAALDRALAVHVAQNRYLGDQFGGIPAPDYNDLDLLRSRAQSLLARPDTAKAAQALIAAIEAERPVREQLLNVRGGAAQTDLMIIGRDYETLDRTLLDQANDAWYPGWLASSEASLRLVAAQAVRLRAQSALAARSPTIPLQPESMMLWFTRQQAGAIRHIQQERGFVLARAHPDPALVAQFNAAIVRLAAVPDPLPGEIDPMRQPHTDQERAYWNAPYPRGSAYGADPGIAFLEGEIRQRSTAPNPDRALIAALQARLAALKAGRAPTV